MTLPVSPLPCIHRPACSLLTALAVYHTAAELALVGEIPHGQPPEAVLLVPKEPPFVHRPARQMQPPRALGSSRAHVSMSGRAHWLHVKGGKTPRTSLRPHAHSPQYASPEVQISVPFPWRWSARKPPSYTDLDAACVS
jgi:hypothetical protein